MLFKNDHFTLLKVKLLDFFAISSAEMSTKGGLSEGLATPAVQRPFFGILISTFYLPKFYHSTLASASTVITRRIISITRRVRGRISACPENL